jgi:hypothetical protein
LLGDLDLGESEHRALRWHDGEVEDITLPDRPSTIVAGIDQDGDVVGTTTFGAETAGFALADDKLVRLGSPAHAHRTYPIAISGDRVAGHAELDDIESGAYVWDLDHPRRPDRLRLPPGYHGYVVDMTPRGRVLVVAAGSTGPSRSYLFSRSQHRRDLTAEMGSDDRTLTAIGRGIAAGQDRATGQSLRYDLRSRAVTLIASTVRPDALDGSGDIGGQDGDMRPALIIGAKTQLLPGLYADGTGTVVALASRRSLAGTAQEAPFSASHAVQWQC